MFRKMSGKRFGLWLTFFSIKFKGKHENIVHIGQSWKLHDVYEKL